MKCCRLHYRVSRNVGFFLSLVSNERRNDAFQLPSIVYGTVQRVDVTKIIVEYMSDGKTMCTNPSKE